MEEGKEIKFIDAEAYQGGSQEKLTFREIVLGHLRKISQYASVEFRGGFWEERSINHTQYTETVRTYISDTREVYSNAVEYLYDLLYPHFDDEMETSGESAELSMDVAFDKNTVVEKEDREDKDYVEGKKEDRKFKKAENRINFRSERRKINRELFRELCCFLKRKDYLKGKEFEEEV